MTDTDTPLFHLLDPQGQEIMNGPMSIIMECLPDTTARSAALDNMYEVAAATVQAEQRANEARAAATQIIADGITRLSARVDSYVEQLEEQRKADAEEAARREQEQIQATLDALPDPDQPTTDPYSLDRRERVASPASTADQDPNEILPPPRETPGPEPGTLDYPPHPQVAAPVAISLNSAE